MTTNKRPQGAIRRVTGVRLAAVLLPVACTALLFAQAPTHVLLTSASLDALDKKLTALLVTSDKTKGVNEQLLTPSAATGLNGSSLMFHRDAASQIEIHENLSDFAFLRAGSGSLVAGGKMVNGTVTAPGETRADGKLMGGTTTKLAPGDLVYIPAGMTHQFIPDPGKFMSVMVIKPAAIKPQDQPSQVVFWSNVKLNALDKALTSKLDATQAANEALASSGDAPADRRALMFHRAGAGLGEIHQKIAEMALVRSGSGTAVVGGKVVDAKPSGPGEIRGPSIAGGSEVKLAAGDVIYIPANQPHRFVPDPGKPLSVIVFKFPAK